MSITYTPATNFTAKDSMSASNPDKVLSGVPFDSEFTAISNSFALAAPALDASFTGTTSAVALSVSSTSSLGTATATTVNGTVTSVWDGTTTTVDAGATGWDATKATVDAGSANWDTAYGWGDHGAAGYTTTDTTYVGGTNITLAGTTFNMDASLTGLTDVETDAISIGSWEIKLDGNDLRFVYDGTDRFRITTAGALIADDNITAYGAP
jgi:hypothetical protein